MPGSPAPQRDAALPVDRREGELRGGARAEAGDRRGQERAGEGHAGVSCGGGYAGGFWSGVESGRDDGDGDGVTRYSVLQVACYNGWGPARSATTPDG